MELEALSTARWFAGKGRTVADVSPLLEAGGIGVIDVRYADSGDSERYLVHDDELRWADLIAALRAGPLIGRGGRLELRSPGGALDAMLDGTDTAERPASLDQSNTLVVVGSRLLVKTYRKLRFGPHPEIVIAAALAGSDAPVPGFGGAVVLVDDAGEEAAVALLQAYVPGATSGWEAMIAPVAARLRGETDVVAPPFADAGAAAAVLHRALSAAMGAERTTTAGPSWHREAVEALEAARRLEPMLDAVTVAELADGLAPLTGARQSVLQRIHGDLNLAQLLFTPSGVLVIDFEGNPTLPLPRRRARDTPVRDVATLLRSIDHVGSAAARRAGEVDPTPWIAEVRAATLNAYEREAGAPVDHALLHALEIVAECRELVYAHRFVPEWAYVARAGLARLLGRPSPHAAV